MRFLADMVSQLRNQEEHIREGGGPKAIENQHSKNWLTARERIGLLVDPGTFLSLVPMPLSACTKNGEARPLPA